LFDDEVDMNTKIKWKANTESIGFDGMVEEINLTEDDKEFLKTN
jgi:hypothetical protein